jgi:hypothetical protein
MGPIGSPETLVLKQPTLCNIPNNDRIQVKLHQKPTLLLDVCYVISAVFICHLLLDIHITFSEIGITRSWD